MLTKLSNSKATKVIIFGGVFDPVHIGHLHIYQTLKSRFQFDRFIIVPAKIPPLKDALPVATINQRLAMLRMMFKKYPNVLISDYELKQSSSTKSYTIGTIKHFRKIFPRAELFLVVGADRYIDFKKWRQWKQILQSAKLIVINRPHITINKKQIPNSIFVDMPLINIASRQLRIEPWTKYLTLPISRYIAQHFLYIHQQVSACLSKYRYEHSLRVALLAEAIARKNQYPKLISKAYVAGMYHDVCKEWNKTQLVKYVGKYDHTRFMTYTTLHGLAGAKYIRQHFHIQDQQIISAVANHVIPSLRPTTLDKIIYCADKLEPARSNNDADNIKSLRQLAFTNIGAAFNTLLTQIQKRYR